MTNPPAPEVFLSAYGRFNAQEREDLDAWYERWLERWRAAQGIEVTTGHQTTPGRVSLTIRGAA